MFDSFISLGFFCGTAASMSGHGLRSFSGPFDWIFSDLDGVIRTIENDFEEFLAEDNLTFFDDPRKGFEDRKYGMSFLHEIEKDYHREIEGVRLKYQRRIERFRSLLSGGNVCFLRAVKDQDEMDYISINRSHISEVLGRSNEIIYLIPEFINIPEDLNERYFILPINRYNGNSLAILRELFDLNEDLLSYCKENISGSALRDNLRLDSDKEKEEVIITGSRRNEYDLISEADYSKLKPGIWLDIYGAGDLGKAFFESIKEYVTVGCFIDEKPQESSISGTPVRTPGDYSYTQGTYIITVCDSGYYKTCKDLEGRFNVPPPRIMDLTDFLLHHDICITD